MMQAEPELPKRPGTTWKAKRAGAGNFICAHCGQIYSRHGAPAVVADQIGWPRSERHLICPAAEEAWEEFNRVRQRATVEKCADAVLRDLERFTRDERYEIFNRISEGLALMQKLPASVKED